MLVFLGVPVALFLVFVVWPFIQAVYYAMTDWTGFQANFNFIGFDNFIEPVGRRDLPQGGAEQHHHGHRRAVRDDLSSP